MPRVSIIFSALNEAQTIEPALRSVLALDYPDLEIIAINDRSTDDTGKILDHLGAAHPALRVLHIDTLPPGWLGKNHALHAGSQIATGEYLLFTDADVVFAPSAIRRAVAHCEAGRLDHLVVVAEMIVQEWLLAMALLNGHFSMYLTHRPWSIRNSPRLYLGMGAFNMVRAAPYRQAGGHQTLAMEVVDDVMLGRLMKGRGGRTDALQGSGMVAVEWYRNTAEFMRGVEKNSLAMLDYRPALLLPMTAGVLLMRLWPWLGLLLTSGASWWLNLATLSASLAVFLNLIRYMPWSRWCLLWWPVSGYITLFIVWRGVILTLLRGGIDWRGTRYPLEQLKAARRGQRWTA